MYPGVLDLQLADPFVLLEEVNMQLLYLIKVVFDEWQVLLVLKLVDFNLKLRMIFFELLHQRDQDVFFPLQVVVLYLKLISSLLLLLQVKIHHLILSLQHTDL